MPELPEVEMARRYLEECCKGRRIERVKVLDEGILRAVARGAFAKAVQGRKVMGAGRHGKQLFIDLGGICLTVHLGMTGGLVMLEGGEKPPTHTRVMFAFEDATSLAYDDPRKFGAIGLSSSVADFVMTHKLGPDALSISKREFMARAQRSRRAIKSLLIDQHVIAGVGNLYADESLFQAKVHPLMSADQLSQAAIERIWVEVRRVLKASIAVDTDFRSLPEGFLLSNRVADRPCPRRNGALRAIKVGGRTTIFCPTCQTLI
ncbi:MAG: DNA-formamidopyrimidine glycosylase [Methanomassiliicoccales archaeon]|nr:DNA-formamidopyrimidine glycosylase [Methanomassiliicoccales archaeon]